MRERLQAWASKAHMTEGAFYVSVGLALLCSMLAGLNVQIFNTSREAKQRVEVLEAERSAEQSAARAARRVEITAQHARCIGGIRSTMIANTVIVGFKEFLLDTAADTQRLIDAEPGAEGNKVRASIVRKRRAQADQLAPFPALTKEQCDNTRNVALRKEGFPVPRG